MYFARKRLWKSLRIVSLTKVLPFFSGAPRAWWRKTTSSFQRLLTAPDGACVRINSKSKGAVKSLAGRRRVEERVRRGGGLGRRGLVLLAPPLRVPLGADLLQLGPQRRAVVVRVRVRVRVGPLAVARVAVVVGVQRARRDGDVAELVRRPGDARVGGEQELALRSPARPLGGVEARGIVLRRRVGDALELVPRPVLHLQLVGHVAGVGHRRAHAAARVDAELVAMLARGRPGRPVGRRHLFPVFFISVSPVLCRDIEALAHKTRAELEPL